MSFAHFLFLFISEVEKNLSAARKKDLDDGEYRPGRMRPGSAGNVPKPSPRTVARTQSANTLISNGMLYIF